MVFHRNPQCILGNLIYYYIASYADVTTIYTIHETKEPVIGVLETSL